MITNSHMLLCNKFCMCSACDYKNRQVILDRNQPIVCDVQVFIVRRSDCVDIDTLA